MKPNSTKQVIVFDIDGTLSNDHWRRCYLPKGDGVIDPSMYDEYNNRMADDEPFEISESIVRTALSKHPEASILCVTARPEKYRMVTARWLGKFFAGMDMVYRGILMRPNGDLRTSPNLKSDLLADYFDEHKARGIHVEYVAAYDDRVDVIHMYEKMGINAILIGDDGDLAPPETLIQLMAKGNIKQSSAKFDVLGSLQVRGAITPEEFVDMACYETVGEVPSKTDAAEALKRASETFSERRAVYGPSEEKTGAIMEILFPEGITLKTAADHRMFHMMGHLVGKLGRFAASGMKHRDSVHDLMAYAALAEAEVDQHNAQFPPSANVAKESPDFLAKEKARELSSQRDKV